MMSCTESCAAWAQWRVTAPERDTQGKIVRLKTVAIVCGRHKNAMQLAAGQSDPPVDLRFNFVGAVPDGAYHP